MGGDQGFSGIVSLALIFTGQREADPVVSSMIRPSTLIVSVLVEGATE